MKVATPQKVTPDQAFQSPAFRRFITGKACNLAQGREDLRDDLEQTAWVAVFGISGAKTLAYFRTVASWRMRDHLRGESRFQACHRRLRYMAMTRFIVDGRCVGLGKDLDD